MTSDGRDIASLTLQGLFQGGPDDEYPDDEYPDDEYMQNLESGEPSASKQKINDPPSHDRRDRDVEQQPTRSNAARPPVQKEDKEEKERRPSHNPRDKQQHRVPSLSRHQEQRYPQQQRKRVPSTRDHEFYPNKVQKTTATDTIPFVPRFCTNRLEDDIGERRGEGGAPTQSQTRAPSYQGYSNGNMPRLPREEQVQRQQREHRATGGNADNTEKKPSEDRSHAIILTARYVIDSLQKVIENVERDDTAIADANFESAKKLFETFEQRYHKTDVKKKKTFGEELAFV